MLFQKKIKKILSSVPNIGRGVGAMVFNAMIFLVLSKGTNKTALYDYTWFLVTGNFFVAFTGWGLKDYSVKEYVKNMHETGQRFSLFLSSKLPLLLVSFIVIAMLHLQVPYKICLMLFILFRTCINLADPLVLVYKKVPGLFIAELFIYVSVITALFLFPVLHAAIIPLLLVTEALRALLAYLLVATTQQLHIKVRLPFRFLYDTRFYFAIALFSFCMSRVDVYVLGACSRNSSFAYYNIVLNLLAVSQIIISSIYNNSIKSVFRVNVTKANAILNKLFLQFVQLSILSVFAIFLIAQFVYRIELSYDFYGLLLINIFLYCITIKQLYILNHINKLNYFLTACILSSAVNSSAAFLLAPSLGMKGALLANTFGVIVLVSVIQIMISGKKGVLMPAS